jgi:type IV secretory pathway TrbD component
VTRHETHRDGTGEQIHLPAPSLIPLATAAGITVALVGLILHWWITAAGLVVAVIAVARWISVVREEIGELPTERR